MSLFQLALTFFIIANPIGNAPGFVALLAGIPIRRQQKILLRETFFALLLCFFFAFFGDYLLEALAVKHYTLTISGGVVLFFSAMAMVFSIDKGAERSPLKQEPFVVPIATPLIAGGGLLTTVVLFSQEVSKTTISFALILAFIPIFLATINAPYLQIFFGKRGLKALEQIVGMVLLMVACDLITKGFGAFILTVPKTP